MFSLSDDQIYSKWVLKNIQRISKSLGVLFKDFKDQPMSLLFEIEKRIREEKKTEDSAGKTKKKHGDGRSRELRRLQSSINYKGKSQSVTKVGDSKNKSIINV